MGPMMCAKCQRREQRKSVTDKHHVAGKANSSATITVPVNDHRADLSAAQQDWPKATLQNPDGSPLLKAAAAIRGFIDTVIYLVNKYLLWIPEMLEGLHEFLTMALGQKWWSGIPLERFPPED